MAFMMRMAWCGASAAPPSPCRAAPAARRCGRRNAARNPPGRPVRPSQQPRALDAQRRWRASGAVGQRARGCGKLQARQKLRRLRSEPARATSGRPQALARQHARSSVLECAGQPPVTGPRGAGTRPAAPRAGPGNKAPRPRWRARSSCAGARAAGRAASPVAVQVRLEGHLPVAQAGRRSRPGNPRTPPGRAAGTRRAGSPAGSGWPRTARAFRRQGDFGYRWPSCSTADRHLARRRPARRAHSTR